MSTLTFTDPSNFASLLTESLANNTNPETCLCSQCVHEDAAEEAAHLEHGYASGQFDRPLPGGPDFVPTPSNPHSDEYLAQLGRTMLGDRLDTEEAVKLGKLYIGHPYY